VQPCPLIRLEPAVEIWCRGEEHVPRLFSALVPWLSQHMHAWSLFLWIRRLGNSTYQAHSIDTPRRKKIPYCNLEKGDCWSRGAYLVSSASSAADSCSRSYATGRAMSLRIRFIAVVITSPCMIGDSVKNRRLSHIRELYASLRSGPRGGV
jgi:hypothetical protein